MGCGGSKADDLALVIRCRERKALIKAAKDHRFALAAAHVSYFHSLNDVGDALRRFVDEELAIPSPPASPVLTLPKTSKKKNTNESNNKHSSSSSTSLSHSGSGSHIHLSEDEDDDHDDRHHLHLHLSSSSSGSDSELDSSRNHMRYSPEIIQKQQGYPPSYYHDDYPPPPQTGWGDPYPYHPPPEIGSWGVYPPSQTDWGGGQFGVFNPTYSTTNTTSTSYYMKRSKPQIQSVIYDPAAAEQRSRSSYSTYTMDMNSAYPTSFPDQNAGFFGFLQNQQPSPPPTSYPDQGRGFFGFLQNQQQSTPPGPLPPPSPKVSGWDFLNPFDMFDSGGYSGYYSSSYGQKDGYGSIASSPDSTEVREREGIPDLEDETEPETFRRAVHHHHYKGRKKSSQENRKKNSGEGPSRAVPSHKQRHSSSDTRPVPLHRESSEGSSSSNTVLSHDNGSSKGGTHSHRGIHSRDAPSKYEEVIHSVDVKEENSSPDTMLTNNTDGGFVRKKGVTFEVDGGPSTHDNGESSKWSSLTTLSAHGTRDIQEVVAEIRDEFATASSYGREVAMLLEVGKLPYQSRFTLLKVILSGIPCMKAPSLSSLSPLSSESVRVATRTMKLAKAYYRDLGSNSIMKSSNLSSTLEKLYEWEKKLYKEVKDEEKLRLIYEKQCKRLKMLDDRGAESSKIDATQASIRKSLTKINVCIKAVDGISNRIHKLRDEELQPQVTDLIYGLIRMWKAMLKCHHKQFQAIMESKAQSLIANAGSRRDSHLRATMELERELLAWSSRFGNWIKYQKSFIESLNGWLWRCLLHEPEVTPDGIVPFSPGRIGAPPIFVICNDWFQANGSVLETGKSVTNAMHSFASSLRELVEKQEEEQKQRLETEYLSEDLEKRLRILRMGSGRLQRDRDAMSDKTGVSIVASDDLKVDLDSIREKLKEGRAPHKEAINLVHSSSSIQAGLIPIFGALDNFTSEAVKAYERVRIQNAQ